MQNGKIIARWTGTDTDRGIRHEDRMRIRFYPGYNKNNSTGLRGCRSRNYIVVVGSDALTDGDGVTACFRPDRRDC
jgi:hypothetical protein